MPCKDGRAEFLHEPTVVHRQLRVSAASFIRVALPVAEIFIIPE
jgi:hypothetical protein